MKENKFRAWDKVKKEYWDFKKLRNGVDDGYLLLDGNGKALMAMIGGLADISKRFIIEQYIGKKDKNGKEIYENEIFEDDTYDNEFLQVVYDDQAALYRFKFIDGECDGQFGDEIALFHLQNMEVIGNINKNKEIIKWFFQ